MSVVLAKPSDRASPDAAQAPSVAPAAASDEVLTLGGVVRFLRSNMPLVAASTVVVGGLGLAVALFFTHLSWEASATLVTNRPTFTSRLRPPTFSIHGYRAILESDAVIDRARRRLVEDSLLAADRKLVLGRDLRSKIYVAERDQSTLAPMLWLAGRASTAELAAAIANAWGEAFVAQVGELTEVRTEAAISLVEQRFDQAHQNVEALEAENVRVHSELEKRRRDLITLWSTKSANVLQETEDRIAAHQIETHKLIEALPGVEELAAKRPAAGSEVTATLRQLVAVHRYLAQTLPYIRLQKSVTDDVLWQRLAENRDRPSREDALDPLSMSLIDQEVNPVHLELSRRLADLELGLVQRAGDSWSEIKTFLVALESLGRTRAATHAKLLYERERVLAELRTDREAAFAALHDEYELRLLELSRRIDQARQPLGELAAAVAQAIQARSEIEGTDEVLIGVPAVAPAQPLPRGLVIRTLAGLVLGFILGIAVALVRQVA